MRKRLTASLLIVAACLCSCNANIVGQDNGKLLSALTPTSTGSIPNPWFLYTEGLNTGDWLRGLDFFSGGAFTGNPVIDFANTTSPDDGSKCWKFSIVGQTGSWYCGMILLQGTGFGDSSARPGVDISAGNFSRCVFRARSGQGASQVSFQAFDNSANAITVTLTPTWQTYSIPLTNSSSITHLKQFFTIVMANAAPATTTPMDLYIDDLRYEQ